VKSYTKKFKSKTALPKLIGASLILTAATPAFAASPNARGLNPSAQSRADLDGFQLAAMKNPCNPCAGKNPCAAKTPCAAHNPCAAKNPCNPCNPCRPNPCAASDRIDQSLVTRPHGTKLATGNKADLIAEGKALFMNDQLSSNGMSCIACHSDYGSFEASFSKPYPHKVAMAAGRVGMKTIDLDEMIQVCMVAPMATKPLPWDSRTLAALTAYTSDLQKSFVPEADENPCAPMNPCAAHNPCAAKNPCAAH